MGRRDQSKNQGNAAAVIEAVDGNMASGLSAWPAASICHGQ
jgi:hypothetical protein